MATYYDLAYSLTGRVPGTPLALAQEMVASAMGKIYDQWDWSFQRAITYANWLCPGNVANIGTVTVTPYSPIVIADATATTAIANGLTKAGVFATTLQFRNLAYSIYNIIAYDTTTNAPYATITLDRPWLEPLSGPGISYQIYQAYFVAPVRDFRKFIEIRDTTNSDSLNFWECTQSDLARLDPQRTNFADPSYVVPAGIDTRPGSSTLGWQMFELWPQQLSYIPYSFSFRRRGVVPESYSDFQTLSPPYPIPDEAVTWRAKEVLFQDAAARAEGRVPGSGRGFTLLAQMAGEEYKKVIDPILAIDLNLNGEAYGRVPSPNRGPNNGDYSNQLGQLHLGGYPGRN